MLTPLPNYSLPGRGGYQTTDRYIFEQLFSAPNSLYQNSQVQQGYLATCKQSTGLYLLSIRKYPISSGLIRCPDYTNYQSRKFQYQIRQPGVLISPLTWALFVHMCIQITRLLYFYRQVYLRNNDHQHASERSGCKINDGHDEVNHVATSMYYRNPQTPSSARNPEYPPPSPPSIQSQTISATWANQGIAHAETHAQ